MNESAIHISSVKREKIGVNKPNDFIVKFNPPLKLNPQFKHFLALDRLSMTYSWQLPGKVFNLKTLQSAVPSIYYGRPVI